MQGTQVARLQGGTRQAARGEGRRGEGKVLMKEVGRYFVHPTPAGVPTTCVQARTHANACGLGPQARAGTRMQADWPQAGKQVRKLKKASEVASKRGSSRNSPGRLLLA